MTTLNHELKYDNCKNCASKCEHAGKDREFVCRNGISCKVIKSGLTISCTEKQYEVIKDSLEYFAKLPWWDIEDEQREEIIDALQAVLAAE